jgi:hypothetical protein
LKRVHSLCPDIGDEERKSYISNCSFNTTGIRYQNKINSTKNFLITSRSKEWNRIAPKSISLMLIVFEAHPNGTPSRYSTSLFVTAGLRLKM